VARLRVAARRVGEVRLISTRAFKERSQVGNAIVRFSLVYAACAMKARTTQAR
jgi:hypothetical protein